MARMTGHQGDVLVRVWFGMGSLALLFVVGAFACAQEAVDENAARQTADRFLLVLERNPRKGTALDKVVAFHLDHGSLDELVSQLREKAQSLTDDKPDEAGRAWLVVGLIEDSRADVESAVEAFQQAERLLPKSAVASYSLGQTLVALNRLEDGAAALERAIQRQPVPTDLLEVFQSLGRVQQRLAPGDKIVEVWDRLEKLVPKDPRVPELIARTLLDDGYWEAALTRYESLAKSAKDPYRRSELELEAFDLRLKLGQTEKGLADADRLLNTLKPEHWLFRETRRRVEEAFLAQDDVAGWIKHLETRLAAQPGDIDAVVRLSRALAGWNRADEARSRLEAAIKVAPSSPDLRLELIELLQSQQKFADAISQYEQLDRIAPNNPDHVREWGLLVLRGQRSGVGGQEDREQVERARSAAAIWRKLVEAKPKDAVVAAQVADWMASADKSLLGDAADLLRKAMELEPDSLSHREQLGEVLDANGKKAESLATWRAMADGTRRTANNLAHLAEVLNRFGYRDETLSTIDAACELDRKSLELRFRQAELRRHWKQLEAAMSALADAAKLADTPETFDRVVQVEVRVLSEGELLTERIEELRANAERGVRNAEFDHSALRTPHSARQLFRLAKYLEAADRLKDATVAARKAVELDPKNGVFLQAAGRMLAADSQWLSAVEVHERLLKLDRRFRIDSLRAITEMELKLGRKDRALKAGRDLLAAAPANPEAAEFVVDLCVHFGQPGEALQILRRASRQNPADRKLAMKLVDRLMDSPLSASGGRESPEKVGVARNQEQTKHSGASRPPFAGMFLAGTFEEAREVLWRVFEKSNKSDDRAEVAKKLGELSVLPGEFAKLIARLERLRFERKMSRDASLALVNVHEQAGDTLQARRELDRLLPQAPRDTDLLKRMVALCESTGDLAAAITHQQRLADITRRRDIDEHLIVLLRRAGRTAEADAVVTRGIEQERDPAKVLREIDRLIPFAAVKNKDHVQQALKLIDSWLARDPQNWEFRYRRASALLEMDKQNEAHAVLDELMAMPLSDDTASVLASQPSRGSSDSARQATRVIQLQRRMVRDVNPFVVADYGAVRSLVLMWRTKHGRPIHSPTDIPQNPTNAELRKTWDAVYADSWIPPSTERIRLRARLVNLQPEDAGANWLFLSALAHRPVPKGFSDWSDLEGNDPLEAALLDQLSSALRRTWLCDEALLSNPVMLAELVCREFVRARQTDRSKELLDEFERLATSPESLAWLIERRCKNHDVDATLRLLPKYAESFEMSRARNLTTAGSAAVKHSDPALIAWWLQRLIWEQVGTDLRTERPNPERLKAAKKTIFRIMDAAFTTFSDPRIPNPAVAAETVLMADVRPDAGIVGRRNREGHDWLIRMADRFGRGFVPPFPQSIDSAEQCALQVAYQAFACGHQWEAEKNEMMFGAAEWLSELREHFTEIVEKSDDTRQAFLGRLCLTSQLVWEDQTAAALKLMPQLFETAEYRPALRLDIVSYLIKQERQELALQLLDRIETPDNGLRKEIEQRALQLATKLKNTDRVRLAAERLFGMKLEPDEELQLAATLSGLGLHEQAEAIRLRLPQRAGNNLLALQQLMDEHSAAKRIDEACAVAEQIVRRTAPANPLIGSAQQATFSGGVQAKIITQHSVARTKALALLGRNGRLEPMIAQAEQQFERSQSLKLFGLLAELYDAAEYKLEAPASESPGNGKPKSLAGASGLYSAAERQNQLVVRLANSDAADPQFRLTLARALVSAGQAKLAVPHFLFAIERLPDATAQVLFEAEQILSELGHVDELAAIVLKSKLDLNADQRIELFRRIVQRLEGPPIRAKLIIRLFEKALREAPGFRYRLADQLLMVGESVWQEEALWPIARDLAVPPQDLPNSWTDIWPFAGIDSVRQTNDNRIVLMSWRTVELAHQFKKLDDLERRVESAAEEHPNWKLSGEITLGLIRLKQGRRDEARPRLQLLLDWFDDVPIPIRPKNIDMHEPSLLKCGLGDVLARAGDFDLAVKFYERSGKTLALERCRRFAVEPLMKQLAVRIAKSSLCQLDDPKAGADYNDERDNRDNLIWRAGNPDFAEVAKITAEINQPYFAARLTQAMITRWQLPNANNSDGGLWLRQLDDRFANARAALKPQMLPEIAEEAARDLDPRSWKYGVPTTHVPFDLLPHVTGDSLANVRLDSPFVSLLQSVVQDQELWVKWGLELKRAGSANAVGDMSLPILVALTELFGPESNNRRTAVEQLLALAQRKSDRPRTLPPGFHSELGLWLVARECLQRDDLKSLGEQLADQAAESASHYFDPRFRWAILRERGELAVKAGDKELAAKLWTQLADSALRPRSTEGALATLVGNQMIWSSQWPLTRLQRTRDLCRLTLNAEMPDVSLAIFRDALDWPREMNVTYPIYRLSSTEPRSRDLEFLTDVKSISEYKGLADEVLATWDLLQPEWRAKGVSANAIFVTLLEGVLPTSRPGDVFVFPVNVARVSTETWTEPHASRTHHGREDSFASRLVELAVAEKRIDSLAQRLSEQEKLATNSLAIRLMWLLLAQQTNDQSRLSGELAKLEQHDWSKPADFGGRIATHIVWRLMPLAETNKSVADLLDRLVSQLAKANSRDEQPLADLRRWQLRRQLAVQQTDKARETISAHLRHMDQIWSAAGAMDAQHLRRLELLALARDFASADLTRDALDLLAQVADARWPDKFPDENPGAVLAILESKLKSLSAQERYELWRSWTLSSDGLKSMRMLTGSSGKSEDQNPKSEITPNAESSNGKSQISNLKSTGLMLVAAARESQRLPELAAFVEQQLKQRPNDRLHVLLALIHSANEDTASAEKYLRRQLEGHDGQGVRGTTTRTRVWDDWLLSRQAQQESLREISSQLAERARTGARELNDRQALDSR